MNRPVDPRRFISDDPLWLVAFPIYYLYMICYGVFATVYYLPSIKHVTPNPAGAQFFGALIASVCVASLAGVLWTIRRRKPTTAELAGHIAVVSVMALYFVAITLAVAEHDAGTRPGGAFVPLMFAVFPAVRIGVMHRWHRNHKDEA